MKAFSIIVAWVLVLALGGVTWGQESPTNPPPNDSNALFEQAEAQMAQGQYAAAVEIYQQLLADLPVSARAQQAAFKAALCFEALDQPARAVEMYDRVVSIGRDVLKPRYYKVDGQKQSRGGGNPASIKDRIERALRNQVVACQRIGDAARGLRAIRYLQAIAPTSDSVSRLIPLRLQLEGQSASQADELIEQQEAAAQLCHQAGQALRTDGREAAVTLLDRVLSEYPDTPAAIRAKADKAELLWLAKRYEEARELYQQILDQIGHIAPDANAARDAKYRIAWFELGRLLKTVQRDARMGEVVDDTQWERIRDQCRVIMELDPDPAHRAEANVALIETYNWQGRYEEVVTTVSGFFRNYGGSRASKDRVLREISWARLFKGIALEKLNRPESAAEEYRRILECGAEHPDVLRDEYLLQRASIRLNRLTITESG